MDKIPKRGGSLSMTVEFGQILRKYREQLSGLSQTKVAQLLDMNPSYWSRLENGNRSVSAEAALRIILVLEIPSEEQALFLMLAAGYPAELTYSALHATNLREKHILD